MTAPHLPDFIVIGATKCGTTSLYDWLSAHPAVWMAPKELRFFTAEHNRRRGIDWYASAFTAAPPNAILGEMSNAYTRDPVYAGVAERIAASIPSVRLIYLVRDPLRRLESHYRHRLVSGVEWRNPEKAIQADPGYLAASLYGHQLARYRARFPAAQILVLRSEALFSDPLATLDQISRFIGIEPHLGPAFSPRNVTSSRIVAPLPVRLIAAMWPAHRIARRIALALGRSSVRRFFKTADQPSFEISPGLRERLISRLREDQRLLIELAGPDAAAWPLEAELSPSS